jgi:hypothetical protein
LIFQNNGYFIFPPKKKKERKNVKTKKEKVKGKIDVIIKAKGDSLNWETTEGCIKYKPKDGKAFHFDKIFLGKDNNLIYEKITPILKQVENGEHGAILAYGQTASGKTFAMEGDENNKGIIPLAIEYFINQDKKIKISIFELQ